MKKIKVACLFGGCSSEYDISLLSATSVIKNINKDKYECIMIGITRNGDFYLYTGNIDDIEKDKWFSKNTCRKITFSTNRSDHGVILLDTFETISIDIVFPILHGKNGECGRLQGLLELIDIPFVGCSMLSSAICMDKYLSKELVKEKGILVPKSRSFTNYDNIEEIIKNISDLEFPLYIKPIKAGSSCGITKVNKNEELNKAIEFAFSYDDSIIIEEEIKGFEVGCAILGNNNLIIGEVDEIDLPNDFFDYNMKYKSSTNRIILPANLSQNERNRIKETALKIYNTLYCEGFARVDMFYTENKEIIFNEVNTIPGCTSHSRFPAMLNYIGYDFSKMIDTIIELGMNRKKS